MVDFEPIVVNCTFCTVCNQPSKSKCSRCNSVHYCSRECQLLHWPDHKAQCNKQRADENNKAFIAQFKCERFLEHANKRIFGNICILAAHHFEDIYDGTTNVRARCTIEVTINESIDEFIQPGSFHFAYLNYVYEPRDQIVSFTPVIKVIYVLNDFKFTIETPITNPTNLTNLKKLNPKPDPDWCIMFEL